ncbi:zinc finger CCCH domain-containing protein 15-like isoform X3 [Tachypleus tridentatus]|uniref:zinc finger CCCH domain-containing protein 15-like isoform X3 n=1 Tax=Tachypleus tridentatus TaxID=6853 RepID=UPI003FD2FA38
MNRNKLSIFFRKEFRNIFQMFLSSRITQLKTQKETAACAKATLMLAKYSEESAVLESNALILMYRDVVAIQPEWEEGHFHLAKYYDRVMTTLEKSEKKRSTSRKKKKEIEDLNLTLKSVTTQKDEKEQCKKGDKCKFSHDDVENKSEKKSIYVDLRDEVIPNIQMIKIFVRYKLA